jgi:type IV fimbrial biogenesis protein FimT
MIRCRAPSSAPLLAPRRAGRGFTLIELMITISIAAILLMIAVPVFENAFLNSKLASQANSLVAGAQLARSEAIKRNAVVRLCPSDGNAEAPGCSGNANWSMGWLVVLADATPIHQGEGVATGFVLTGPGGGIAFGATGMADTAAILKLCRATPSVGSHARQIRISATGHPSVESISGGSTCPAS